jgi:hypothetical protein
MAEQAGGGLGAKAGLVKRLPPEIQIGGVSQ